MDGSNTATLASLAAQSGSCVARLGADGLGDVSGLLRVVRVLSALVHLEVQSDAATEAPLGQHALHCVLNDALRQTL